MNSKRMNQKDWPAWRDAYREQKPLTCPMCGKAGKADLSTSEDAFIHACGHRTYLPPETPISLRACGPGVCALLCEDVPCREGRK